MPEWLRSREPRSFAASGLAVGVLDVLDAGFLLGVTSFGPVNALGALCPGTRAGAVARRHPATALLALENRAFLADRHSSTRAWLSTCPRGIRAPYTRSRVVAEALVRSATALLSRAVSATCATSTLPVRHAPSARRALTSFAIPIQRRSSLLPGKDP